VDAGHGERIIAGVNGFWLNPRRQAPSKTSNSKTTIWWFNRRLKGSSSLWVHRQYGRPNACPVHPMRRIKGWFFQAVVGTIEQDLRHARVVQRAKLGSNQHQRIAQPVLTNTKNY
jgi:hypothetical protein